MRPFGGVAVEIIMNQTDKLYALLSDGKEHSTPEILRVVYGSEHLGIARISARVLDARKRYKVNIVSHRHPDHPTIYLYKMEMPEQQPLQL